MSALDVLTKNALFQNVNAGVVEALASKAKEVTLSPGEALFYEGDESSSMYFIQSGTIAIKKSTSDGDEDLVKVGAGAHLGEMTYLVAEEGVYEKRSASAEAAESITLYEVSFADLTSILSEDQSAGFHFYQNLAINLARKIRKTNEDISSLRSLRLKAI